MIEREYLKIQSSMAHYGQSRHGDTESVPIKQHCTLLLFIDMKAQAKDVTWLLTWCYINMIFTFYQFVFFQMSNFCQCLWGKQTVEKIWVQSICYADLDFKLLFNFRNYFQNKKKHKTKINHKKVNLKYIFNK